MSLPLDFLSAAGHELPALPTPDSRALGSRPVYKHEVPTRPVPSHDDLIPVPPPSPPLYPSSIPPSPPSPILKLPRESARRHLLPPAMTDLQLCMEWGSLPLTPFSHFVAPELFLSPKRFPRFMDLPPEIHRIIFQSCNTPTLFHLMHTSSYIRSECLALFWESGHNVWYQPYHAYQIFTHKVSPVYHCHTFASRITHVEIPLYLADYHQMAIRGREFWDRLQELFPSARNVVLSSIEPRRRPLASEDDSQYLFVSELVELAPPSITPFVAINSPREYDEDEHGLCYRLWRVKAYSWNLVEDTWRPMRVLLPPKKVPHGLLNDFLTSDRLFGISWRERKAINWLKLETYARFSDSSGIECPDPKCKPLKFHTLKEFKKHISDKCHVSPWYTRDGDLVLCHPNTPVDVRAVLDTKQRRVDKMVLMRNALNDGLRDQYRRPGDAKLQFEESLTAQMKEHGYLAPDESLGNAYLWCCRDDELFEFDHPEYPDVKDIDPECPEEECLDRDYAGEEYFEYPD